VSSVLSFNTQVKPFFIIRIRYVIDIGEGNIKQLIFKKSTCNYTCNIIEKNM